MAVAARTVNSLTEAANARHEALAQASVRAGTYSIELGDEVMTGWHSHEFHQLEYALEGVAEVETATARYLLPPRQALWIPAGVEHSSTLTHVKAVSVFFDPEMVPNAGDRVRILAAAPVLREMIRYARRWPISRSAPDPVAVVARYRAARLATMEQGATGAAVEGVFHHDSFRPLQLADGSFDPFAGCME